MNEGSDDSASDDPFRTASQLRGADGPGDDSFPRSVDSTIDVAGGGRIESSHVNIGERIGRYEITGALGAGGMGVVFKAHDTAIDRVVAIKALLGNIATNSKALDRFLVEARAAGRLSHQNAVPVYEIGESAGIQYLVMECAPGGSVAARIERDGAFSAVSFVNCGQQASIRQRFQPSRSPSARKSFSNSTSTT